MIVQGGENARHIGMLRLFAGWLISLPVASITYLALSPTWYYLRNGVSYADVVNWPSEILKSLDKHVTFLLIITLVAGFQYLFTAIPISVAIASSELRNRFRSLNHFALMGAILAATPWFVINLVSGLSMSFRLGKDVISFSTLIGWYYFATGLAVIAISGAIAGMAFGMVILVRSCRGAASRPM